MSSYRTVRQTGRGIFEEKKSVFRAEARPVATEAEALEAIEDCKKCYPDASHHVYAYVLREGNLMRYTDDHEPSGTAGLPVLDLIRKKECTDLVITVARYFGGALLGTGGLVRAYTEAASAALDDAGIAVAMTFVVYEIALSYAEQGKFLSAARDLGFRLTDTVYDEGVRLIGEVAEAGEDAFLSSLNDLFFGRARVKILGKKESF